MPQNMVNNTLIQRTLGLFNTLPGGKYSPIVDELMRWQVTNEFTDREAQPFYRKAVQSLVRKLKRSSRSTSSGVEALVSAIQKRTSDSACIRIPRSLDGRMQVSQKKVLPHVLYCTIWRYPELKNHHELRPLPCCAYSYNAKKDEVCINPYHYERIRQATVPPVLVPRLPSHQIPERFSNFVLTHESVDRASEEETDWVVAGNKTLPLDGYLSPDSDTDPFSQAPSPDSVITTASTTSTQISVIKGLFKPEYTLQGGFDNMEIGEVSSPSMPSSPESGPDVDIKIEADEEPMAPAKTEVAYQEIPEWCTIHYYEMNKRFGEPFQDT